MGAGFAFSFLVVAIFSSSVTLWMYIRSFPAFKAHWHKTESNHNVGGGGFQSVKDWEGHRYKFTNAHNLVVLITQDPLPVYLQPHQYRQSIRTHIFKSKVED